MSLPSPQVVRLLPPPPIPPPCSLNPNLTSAVVALAAKTDLTSCPKTNPPTDIHKGLTLHPYLPLAAYLIKDVYHTVIVIQDWNTQQVWNNWLWMDLAAIVYGEKNASQLAAATKSLGTIERLEFLDATWNGFVPTTSTASATSTPLLMVQTAVRILVLCPQQTPHSGAVLASHHSKHTRQAVVKAHIHDKVLGSVPSSNLLALDATTWLVGCADGSLKAWDGNTNQPIKSIKGLGKNDWIVQIVAANSFVESTTTTTTTTNTKKRILTVTKKGTVYLIELQVTPGAAVLELNPPLARFVGGATLEDPLTEYGSLVRYDAHRDWLLWLAPTPTTNTKSTSNTSPTSSLLVWNLQALQNEFVKSDGAVCKPEPTLTVQFPAAGPDEGSSALIVSMLHCGFHESTLVCAVATSSGQLVVHAATAHPNNAVSTTVSTPVMGVNLSQLLQRDLSLDNAPLIRIHTVRAATLSPRSHVVIGTNVGLVVVDMELPLVGARHLHFGAGLGSVGKSVLYVQHSDVMYGSLDVMTSNPSGRLTPKNPTLLYESPPAMNLPSEYQKRSFRLAPSFVPSPSGLYVCLFWPFEFRYEILHIPSLLQKVGQRGGGAGQTFRNANVASGTGITGFCWIGDEDDYALLHAESVMEEAILLMTSSALLGVSTGNEGGLTMGPGNMNLMGVANLAKSATKAASATLNATKAATDVTLNATKAATNVTLNATKAATSATLSVTKAATSATMTTTKAVRSSVTKGVKKSLGIFGKKKKGDSEGGIMDGDETEDTESTPNMTMPDMPMPSIAAMPSIAESAKRHHVELRSLVAVEMSSSELSATIAAATSSGLGDLPLRGGNRNPPTIVFGGPVLIVGSRSEEDRKGHAHFYTRKQDVTDTHASAYVSTGPTLPYPDLCAWDDDGRLCAVVVENRVAVYLSELPDFTLLGTVRIGGTSKIVSVRFVHGVLYCCSWNSVYCIFLGDLNGSICKMDLVMLASCVVSSAQTKLADDFYFPSFAPPVLSLPLVQPVVLGYQSGSLIVSTVRGVHAIPLAHPLLRIGTLLASGQVERAAKWLDAVPNKDHEALASFLERRGHAQLAIQLPGLSLETLVDISMRYGFVGRLEEVVEEHGVKGLRAIDFSRGVSTSYFGPERYSRSVVVCVGAYLLAHGKVELARRLATELLRHGEDGKRDALFLATLLLSVDEVDATRLMNRAVDDDGKAKEWLVGRVVRDMLSERS